jgi:hypothetical protein
MRNFQLSKDTVQKPKDVLILVRISSIYTQPCFHFFVDPWSLVTAGHFKLPSEACFQAVIDPITLALSSHFEIPQDTYHRKLVNSQDTDQQDMNTGKASQGSGDIVRLQTAFVDGTQSSRNLNRDDRAHRATITQWFLPAPLGVYNPNIFPSPQHTQSHPYIQSSGIFAATFPIEYTPRYTPHGTQVDPANNAHSYVSSYGHLYSSINSANSSSLISKISQPKVSELTTRQHGPVPGVPKQSKDCGNDANANFCQNYWRLRQWVPPHAQTYIYRPLKKEQFRLLVLFPGEGSESISGAICQHSLHDKIPYQSLSYTWGSPSQKTYRMWTPEGCLCITESLLAGLQRLRSREGVILLWVDALCINQEDELEKRDQIRLLPKIYQQASCTLALVGTDQNSNDAIEMLMQIRAKQTRGSDFTNWPKNLAKPPASWGGRSIPPPQDCIWRWVTAFFKRDWFQRAWIVQEAIAAPTVKIVCGKWMFDWNDLYFALELIEKELEATRHVDRSSWKSFMILARHREWHARQTRWSLFLLLETFRHVESTLMRDRFFSLLGLAGDGNLSQYDPDYNISTSFENIVCRFARAFITQGYGMQMLHRAGLGTQPDRFPSWIPDWTSQRPDSISESLGRGIAYAASGKTESQVLVLPGANDVISVRSILVDEITHISRSFNRPKEPSRLAQYFREIDSMIDNHLQQKYTKGQRDRLKWRVPVADAQHPKVAITGEVDLYKSYTALRTVLKRVEYRGAKEAQYLTEDLLEKPAVEDREGTDPGLKESSLNYHALVQDSIKGWRFVITKNGHCGIVPRKASVGDSVAIFSGGCVPFLLQKGEDDELQKFRLVGECYIHDIMHGEATKGKDSAWGVVELY